MGNTAELVDHSFAGGSPSIEQPDYWWYRVRSELLQVALSRWLGTGERILDVGSADGPSVGWLSRHGSVLSLDHDPRGLRPPRGVCGSVLQLPFADGAFDLVTAFDVLEHCDPEQVAVAELARVLRPGGRMLMSVPAYQWAWGEHDVANHHHRRYTRPGAVAALEAGGLRVERATYAFAGVFPFFAAERVARRVVRRLRPRVTGPADVVEVPDLPAPVERILLALTRLDRRLLRARDLPFGSSVLVAAAKPEPAW